MDIEAEINELKQQVLEVSRKLDSLMYERESTTIMRLSEASLSGLFEGEANIYRIADLDVLKVHLDHLTQELTEVRKIIINMEVIDREKIERAWRDLVSVSEEVSRDWKGPTVAEEIRLQREKI